MGRDPDHAGNRDHIHNFGLYSESNGEPQKGFKTWGRCWQACEKMALAAMWRMLCKEAKLGASRPGRGLLQLAR